MNTRIDSNEQMTRVMFFLIPALFLGLIYLLPLILSTEEIRALAIEDGVVEYVGALFFLLASLTFFALYFGKNGRPSSRNIFYLLLGLGFLFVCLEEISWGQRILGFSTPESIRQTNAQGEFNIHNLKVFHGKTETGERKSFWGLLLNADRLFSMFWFSFCCLIPLAYRYASQKVTYFLDRIRMPIPPLFIAVLFIANYAASKVLEAISNERIHHSLVEFKESNIAILFFVLAVWFSLESRKTPKSSPIAD